MSACECPAVIALLVAWGLGSLAVEFSQARCKQGLPPPGAHRGIVQVHVLVINAVQRRFYFSILCWGSQFLPFRPCVPAIFHNLNLFLFLGSPVPSSCPGTVSLVHPVPVGRHKQCYSNKHTTSHKYLHIENLPLKTYRCREVTAVSLASHCAPTCMPVRVMCRERVLGRKEHACRCGANA